MSVSTWTYTITQQAVFTHANSGYANTTAGPTTNSLNVAYNSGSCYLKQTTVASGATFSVDFASGGNTDLVGDVVNFSKMTSLFVSPGSGAIQIETYQSGGMNVGQLSTQSGYPSSGYGILVNPGAAFSLGDTLGSGYNVPVSAGKGNLVFRAVSGGCLLSVGAYGN